MKQNKSVDTGLQIIILAFLFVTVLLPIQKMGLISNLENENIYWERARFLLGQGGASLYDGSSLASLGYSLILLPICALVKSPYAAYKTAILLNGIFLCGSYFVSYLTVRKLFPNEKKIVLSGACFFSAICPIFTTAKVLTGPTMISMFLVWLLVYLLVELCGQYEKMTLIWLAVCVILLCFFQISLLGIALGVIITLFFLVKEKKVAENGFLFFVLAVLIGLGVGNISERAVIYTFVSDSDTVVSSSLEVLLDGIGAGWGNGYLYGIWNAMVGKLYSAMVGSFLLICPGIWFLIKKVMEWKKGVGTGKKDFVCCGIFFLLCVQFIWISLYDNAQDPGTGLCSLSALLPVLAPVILLGIIQVKQSEYWTKELMGYLFSLCICTFLTANVYQAEEIDSISEVNNGILMIFQAGGLKPVSLVYMSACVVILIAIVLWSCIKGDIKKKCLNKIFRICGILIGVSLCGIFQIGVFQNTVEESYESNMKNIAPIASILSDIRLDSSIYYLQKSERDDGSVVLQSLIPDKEIHLIENQQKEKELFYEEMNNSSENTLIITGTGKSVLNELKEEKIPGFRLMYMTENYALWAPATSLVYEEAEAEISKRVEYPEEKEIEEASDEEEEDADTEIKEETSQRKKVYGGNILLAPGTYRLEIYFDCKEDMEDKSGKVTVSDGEGELVSKEFPGTVFDENGKGSVGLEFSSKETLRNVSVEISGNAASTEIENVYYWKTTAAYTEGINNENSIALISNTIMELDASAGTQGEIAYVSDGSQNVSMDCFKKWLPDYDIFVMGKEEISDLSSEYLIGNTEGHPYFGAMENYSIIQRTEIYTILVRNDSEQYRAYEKEYGSVLSEGRSIRMAAWSKDSIQQDRNIALESGSYQYHMLVQYEESDLFGTEDAAAASILVYDGTSLIGQKMITNGDLLVGRSGEAEIVIPFSLRVATKKLNYKIEMESVRELSVLPQCIELTAEKYQFGQEEPMLQPCFDLVKRMGEGVKLCVAQSEETFSTNLYGYDYLQEQLPQCEISVLPYEKVYDLTEDTLLLTRGFNKSYLQLLDQYSIIGHAMQYTLWARSDGGFLQKAVRAGAAVYSSGKKISVDSIAMASGKAAKEDVIESLPKAKYKVTLEAEAPDLKIGDIVEVTLFRDKTAGELNSEVKEFIEKGYTEEEAMEEIDKQVVCGTASYDAYRFSDTGNMLITIGTTGEKKLTNLTFDIYSWQGADVKGKIVWIELE